MELILLIVIVVLLAAALAVAVVLALQSKAELAKVQGEMHTLTEKNYTQQVAMLETVTASAEKQTRAVSEAVEKLQESNEKKLEEMRLTVDEKLTDTLNKRINASFSTVSEQLREVYKSLGDMMRMSGELSQNVGGLNRVLTNVKSRGTWAEVQLGNILDQTIPGMYETNVKTNPAYNGQVEFAVRIPGSDGGDVTWLPIDSKFPMEDYARLVAAADEANPELLEAARKALEKTVKNEARMIKQYISVPETTPFAIMYLATEGLYAEIMRSRTGIVEWLQQENIMVAGPSTVTALLNSLAMGFKSVAINKKANEVFRVLGAAKAQYEKFGEQLALAKRRIELAGTALDEADKRNEIIKKRLKSIEALDAGEADGLLED